MQLSAWPWNQSMRERPSCLPGPGLYTNWGGREYIPPPTGVSWSGASLSSKNDKKEKVLNRMVPLPNREGNFRQFQGHTIFPHFTIAAYDDVRVARSMLHLCSCCLGSHRPPACFFWVKSCLAVYDVTAIISCFTLLMTSQLLYLRSSIFFFTSLLMTSQLLFSVPASFDFTADDVRAAVLSALLSRWYDVWRSQIN